MTTNTTQDNAPGKYSRKALDGFLDYLSDNSRLDFETDFCEVDTRQFIDNAARYDGVENAHNERPETIDAWADLLIDTAGDIDGVDGDWLESCVKDTLPVAWRDYVALQNSPPVEAGISAADGFAVECLASIKDEAQRLVAGATDYAQAAFAKGDLTEARRVLKGAADYARNVAADLARLAAISPPQGDFIAGAYPLDDLRELATAQGVIVGNSGQQHIDNSAAAQKESGQQ